jgi:MFS family permease
MADTAVAGARDRDAGLIQGILLACVPTMIVATTCAALPILPAIIRAFPSQPNIEQLVPLVAVLPTLTVAFTSIAAGVLGEKLGRRRLLIIGTAVFAISAIMPLWLNSFILVLVSRAVAGLAVGVMITSAVALTGDYYSGATLQKWLAAQGGAGAIAGVLVSAASGALGEISWRYAFLPLFVGIPLFAGLVVVPAPKVEAAHVHQAVAQDAGGPAPWATWLFVFGLAVVGTAIIFPPAYELGVLLHEKALGTSLLTGLGVAVLAAAAAVAAFSMGVLRRLPPPTKAALAIGAAGAGTILIAQATTLAPLMLGAAMVGVGQGLLGPVLSIWLLERTPDRLRGRAVGIYTTVTFLTLFVAPLIARWAAVGLHTSSAAMRWYAIADLVVVAALVVTMFRRPSPAMAPAE